jgi:uncharacterized protein YyaL (SSP411 family)
MSRNRLGETASPYLRQHADNPVHWRPWTPEAFDEARTRNVPIHLSIGYAACHWCHVMAEESFSNPEIAAYLNDHFVNIKVDREERPDVDQIYMKALHALGEQGGWPLTMFISPDGEPFWGGTYFPPEPRWGRPGFPQILQGISAAWQRGDEAIAKNRSALLDHLRQSSANPATANADPSILDQSAERILSIWDHDLGGIRGAPKFPSAPVLDLLWRASLRNQSGDPFRTAVLNTLSSLCSGGIYDHLAGGFARYSVDEKWLVPHFEKMLSDNGQLLSLITRAWTATGEPLFRDRLDQTAGWLIAGMQLPEGGFAASLDADTDHVEGLTYVWTKAEIDAALGDESDLFCSVYDVTEAGNWEGKTVLNRLNKGQPLYRDPQTEQRLEHLRGRLLEIRNERPQPGRDEKVLADWNGVTITALAEAATATGQNAYLKAAEKAYRFICGSMQENGRLCHSWCDGRITSAGLATDYAQMIRAAIALHSATGMPAFLDQGITWFDQLVDNYIDSDIIYLTPADNSDLIVRPVAATDEAMPSAAGIMLQVATHLFTLTGESRFHQAATDILSAHAEQIGRDIIGAASLQSGFDTVLRSRLAYILKGKDGDDAGLSALVLAEADPALILLRDPADGTPPPKQVQAHNDAAAQLYLCEANRCRPPASDPDAISALLTQTRRGRAHGQPDNST